MPRAAAAAVNTVATVKRFVIVASTISIAVFAAGTDALLVGESWCLLRCCCFNAGLIGDSMC